MKTIDKYFRNINFSRLLLGYSAPCQLWPGTAAMFFLYYGLSIVVGLGTSYIPDVCHVNETLITGMTF